MYKLRLKDDRGKTKTDWLDSSHTFSYAGYMETEYMGFGDLIAINDNFIMPNSGFEEHMHENVEILNFVLEGALEHKDSLGNVSVLGSGEVQRITPGKNVLHSDLNPSLSHNLHFIQAWVRTNSKQDEPEYLSKKFAIEARPNLLHLVVSHDGDDKSISINQDLRVYQAYLETGKTMGYKVTKDRMTWVHIISGYIDIKGIKNRTLEAGDGLGISDEEVMLEIKGAGKGAGILIFSLRVV